MSEVRAIHRTGAQRRNPEQRPALDLAAAHRALRTGLEAFAVTEDLDRSLVDELPRLAAATGASHAFVVRRDGHEALFDQLQRSLPLQGPVGACPEGLRAALGTNGATLVLPIRSGNEIWGVIGIEDADAGRSFGDGEADILAILATAIGAAAQRIAASRRFAAEQARFEDLTLAASDWYWEQDADLRFTFIAKRRDGINRIDSTDLMGKTPWDANAGVTSPEAWARHRDDLSARRPFDDFRLLRRSPDGAEYMVSISGKPVHDADGRFMGYRGMGRDITPLVQAERRASTAQTMLRNALEALGDAIVIYGPDWRLSAYNQSFVAMFPHLRSLGELRGKHVSELRSAAQGAGLRFDQSPVSANADSLRDVPWTDEVTLPDGRIIVMRNFPTEGGGWVGIRADVTASRRHEAELRHAKELAESANRAKSSFLANMSHELRTPLNAVIGFSELLKNEIYGPLGSDRYREYATDIHSSGMHLLELINDVLDMSRIETGKFVVAIEDIAPTSITEDVVRLMMVEAQRKEIELHTSITHETPRIRADRRALRQILFNLLSNAIKFTPEHGEVSLDASIDGEFLHISVVDSGVGIPKADIPRLARPFEQVANALTRATHGSGLGLAISKALAELQGGRLEIESELGRGTTISVWMPLAG
ncbi:sensor histidine kinase [Desertibaculum subflavum]|uniref:sensor histidine kinase n=1 Tax=Desertibaculum subflavum TaxID=2268458 RepID=UPI000E67290C